MLPSWMPIILLFAHSLVHAKSRTRPPRGAVVVRQKTTAQGEFSTISAAINSLPNDSTARSIFIYPGTYLEQVDITRAGPLKIYGFTTDASSFTNNRVTISHSASFGTAGSDDLSGTLRVRKDDFSLYNVDVRNTFQGATTNGQAIAISAYGNRMGVYASRFFSFQDTLYARQGTQVYAKSYIEGAVDFIFGREGQVYFEGNTIASIAAGCITASGRSSNDAGMYILNNNTLIVGPNAADNTDGNVYLGRPWGDYARVVFKNTITGSQLNPALWAIWDPGNSRTDHVVFATYNTGSDAPDNKLASFATVLTARQAAQYTIAMAVGADYTDWVDFSYLSAN